MVVVVVVVFVGGGVAVTGPDGCTGQKFGQADLYPDQVSSGHRAWTDRLVTVATPGACHDMADRCGGMDGY